MKPLHHAAACVLLLAIVNSATAQPQHEAIGQYKAFMSAVRAGKFEDVIKLVEPVPKDAAPMVEAALKLQIAYVGLKDELTAQFGLPGPKDEDEFGERAVAARLLDNLRADVQNERIVVLHAKDPQMKNEYTLGMMVHRNGKWLVSAALLTDQLEELKPDGTFKTPTAAERRLFIEHAKTTTKAIEAILRRLKKKEFKSRAEVVKAFSDAMPKAEGEIDIGDGCRSIVRRPKFRPRRSASSAS
jgi:hypothetical protein